MADINYKFDGDLKTYKSLSSSSKAAKINRYGARERIRRRWSRNPQPRDEAEEAQPEVEQRETQPQGSSESTSGPSLENYRLFRSAASVAETYRRRAEDEGPQQLPPRHPKVARWEDLKGVRKEWSSERLVHERQKIELFFIGSSTRL